MNLRGFFARHRTASAVAAPAMLGVAAIVAASFVIPSGSQSIETELTSQVTDCHDMVTVSIAGRNDTPVPGETLMLIGEDDKALPAAQAGDYNSVWLDPIINAPGGPSGDYAAMYIQYPANMATYEDAVNAGVENTQQVMRAIQAACPDTQFSIVGYSEGADVARRVAMNIGNQEMNKNGEFGIVDPARVLGVVILADAGRAAGQGPFPGAENPYTRPDNFDTNYQDGKNAASGKGALPDIGGSFGALDGKVAAFCSDGDLTCAAPENISLLQLAVNVGRQINVDALEAQGLTPATGQDVAATLGRIAMAAFADIQSQENWMQSDETFLEVLLKVSTPGYELTVPEEDDAAADSSVGTDAAATKDSETKEGETPDAQTPDDGAISGEELSPLAYLPQKFFKEIIGLIMTNQNTIPVVMNDPYNLTLGPNATGHHFDYWDNANPAAGKPLTSAEYAAAWLTHLAGQAAKGEPLNTDAKPDAKDLATALAAASEAKAEKVAAKGESATVVERSSTEASAATDENAVQKSAEPTVDPTSAAEVTPEIAAPPVESPASSKAPVTTESEAATTTAEPTETTTTTSAPRP